jgi:hypothetical protein
MERRAVIVKCRNKKPFFSFNEVSIPLCISTVLYLCDVVLTLVPLLEGLSNVF